MKKIVIATLYKFVSLPDCDALQEQFLQVCLANEVKGSLLLATEGINGTLAGSREGIDAVLAHLRSDERLTDLTHQESYSDKLPFQRTKVKIKPEIVTIGLPEVQPTKKVGTYVQPNEWNHLIREPDVTLIDTRNEYEVQAGTFGGAINPHTETFGEFPEFAQNKLDPKEHKKVAMFCTGGIRCEKASSLLLDMGFEEVYHLKGGILNYLKEVPQEETLWQGNCFVFDERRGVDHDLKPAKKE